MLTSFYCFYFQNEVDIFYPTERKRIIAKTTFDSLIFTTRNLCMIVRFLLLRGEKKVCLRNLSQDVLEALFGNLVRFCTFLWSKKVCKAGKVYM